MDWLSAAQAFPPLTENDIAQLQLSKEEKEQVLTLFNKAVSNAQSDSADIAMIALKKLLTQYPGWGEAALLYGICLAIDGKFKRAAASFEHALSAGLLTEELTYMAQVCGRDAGIEYTQEHRHIQAEDETPGKNVIASIFSSKKKRSVFREIETEERGHMQAPILTRVPRSTGKAKLASDRERRDVMMQSNAPQGDSQDEEIDVSIPRTPAEKLRITVVALGSVLLAVLLGFAIWFLIIPAVNSYRENINASARLEYLLASMKSQASDPEISRLLSDYDLKFAPPTGKETNSGTVQTDTAPVNATTMPEEAASVSITPTPLPETQGSTSAVSGTDPGVTAAVSPSAGASSAAASGTAAAVSPSAT